MNDTSFMQLVWWVMAPLVLLFALWAQLDCLRSGGIGSKIRAFRRDARDI